MLWNLSCNLNRALISSIRIHISVHLSLTHDPFPPETPVSNPFSLPHSPERLWIMYHKAHQHCTSVWKKLKMAMTLLETYSLLKIENNSVDGKRTVLNTSLSLGLTMQGKILATATNRTREQWWLWGSPCSPSRRAPLAQAQPEAAALNSPC